MKYVFTVIVGLLFTMCASFATNAQKQAKFEVRGVLVDSVSSEPEAYATVSVFAQKGNNAAAIVADDTKEDGKFSLALKTVGKYTLKITSVGKKDVIRNFTISQKNKVADLGELKISTAENVLQGVVVEAQKILVKNDVDKISYDIENDPDSKTNTVIEMLRKVPLVTVDGEDNIQVKGSGNFKVYVNGKPHPMISNNPKEILRSMPATSVKNVEVITDPGAKYDAEGVGAILNIITYSNRVQGYNLSLNGSATNTRLSGGVYGTAQVGKFTVQGNFTYNHDLRPDVGIESLREDLKNNDDKWLAQSLHLKSTGNFKYGSLAASYEIDSLNLITLNASLWGGGGTSNYVNRALMTNVNNDLRYKYNGNNDGKSSYNSPMVGIDYQRSFKKKDEFLTFSYRFDYSPSRSEACTYYDEVESVPFPLIKQATDSKMHNRNHTAQVDYVNPLTEMHYIDFGAKFNSIENASDSHFWEEDGKGNMIEIPERSSKYNQTRNILAAYADYQLKYKKFGVKVGARYERTFMKVMYDMYDDRDYSAGFNDVVPSARLSYNLSPMSSLRASYTMRIGRPGIHALNPFVDDSDPTTHKFGNPDLDTERSHQFGITFSKFSTKFNINVNLNYDFVNNAIMDYSILRDRIMYVTYGNIGKTRKLGLHLWTNWNPTGKTRLMLNASTRYGDYKSEILNRRNNGLAADFYVNAQQTLPLEIIVSVYGGANTPDYNLNGKTSANNYYGISITKSFLKEKRLTLTAFGTSLFKKYSYFESHNQTEDYKLDSSIKYQSLNFGLSVSMRFGKLNAGVKKANRTIENDAPSSAGSKSAGAPN